MNILCLKGGQKVGWPERWMNILCPNTGPERWMARKMDEHTLSKNRARKVDKKFEMTDDGDRNNNNK